MVIYMQSRVYICFVVAVLLMTAGSSFAGCNPNIVASTGHLVGNADGTVSDGKNKLMWKRCPEGFNYVSNSCTTSGGASSYTWSTALTLPATANNGSGFANKTNWRLPNIKELHSIVEEQCYNPALNIAVFPSTSVLTIWSNSPADPVVSGSSWYINFYYGEMAYGARSTSYGVRLVRDCPECN
jgi:hypothetical protein